MRIREREEAESDPPMRRGAMARLAVAARAFSASPSGACASGVSMVQGASRGIGLEFVSPPRLLLPPILLSLSRIAPSVSYFPPYWIAF